MHFSEHDFRGVSYVREVIDKLIPAMELPGGVYNFGSGNDCDMFETASRFARLLGWKSRSKKTIGSETLP